MAMVNISGMMVACMRESGTKTRSTVGASTSGQMEESTRVSGRTTTCTARECIPGRTVGCMRVTTRTIESTDMVSTPTQMADVTKESGPMVNSMEKVYLKPHKAIKEKGYGKMERESIGLRKKINLELEMNLFSQFYLLYIKMGNVFLIFD